jgi:DNA-binding transcriptional ArsR family regulator
MDLCLEKCVHEDVVEKVVSCLPDTETIQQLADIFKALSEPSRLKIVTALLHDELCVCDLSAVSRLSESAVSHQLRTLRHQKIVTNRRSGKIVYYQLSDDHVRQLINICLDHVSTCD